MLYTIADTHLSLTTEKPMDVFGPRWANHDQKLRENWLKTVTENDTVVLPGDISWGISLEEALEDLKFLDALPGRKLIGKGNHDYWWTTVNKMTKFFEENSITTLSFLYNNAYLVEDKIVCGTRGWMSEFGVKAALSAGRPHAWSCRSRMAKSLLKPHRRPKSSFFCIIRSCSAILSTTVCSMFSIATAWRMSITGICTMCAKASSTRNISAFAST